MADPTAYQYAKLGSNLEYLRGITSVSLMQTSSLVEFPNLLQNLPAQRYNVQGVVEAVKSTLILLEEMKLEKSLEMAQNFRPMLEQMEEYLAKTPNPATAFLQDHFANNLIAIAGQVAMVMKPEMGEKAG